MVFPRPRRFCSFSEAIREGAKLAPQCSGVLIDLDGHTCAIGAGLQAMGMKELNYTSTERALDALILLYPYLARRVNCPDCGLSCTMGVAITCLNDDDRWTREQIADWLESEEEKLGYVTLIESEASQAQEPTTVSVLT